MTYTSMLNLTAEYIYHKQQYSDLVKIIPLIILIMLHYLLVNV